MSITSELQQQHDEALKRAVALDRAGKKNSPEYDDAISEAARITVQLDDTAEDEAKRALRRGGPRSEEVRDNRYSPYGLKMPSRREYRDFAG